MRTWYVAGGLLLAYALWRAYAPRPVDPSDTDDTSADDSAASSEWLQSVSNVIGTGAVTAGFDDAAGYDDDDDSLTSDDADSLSNDFGEFA